LDDGETGADKALAAHILVEATAEWQNITLQLRQAFLMGLPCVRGTQEADVTGIIDHQEVLDRVALLDAVIFLLVLGIDAAVERALRDIRPIRGGERHPPAV